MDRPFERFYTKALRFLSKRPRSEKEVRDNLIKKKASPKIIDEVLTKLKEQRYVNDVEFASWWMEQRIRFRPRSIKVIKMELQQKGIAKETIELTVNNEQLGISEVEGAKRIVGLKIKRYKGLERNLLYQKLGGILARKGYDWDTIKDAIDEVVKEGYNTH